MRAQAAAAWNTDLRKVEVCGGGADQRTTFYTALYHSMLEPTLTSDVNGQYLGGDRRTHTLSRASTRSTAPSPAGTSTARRCSS